MEIPGISVTVRDSGWRSNNMAEIVGNGSRGFSDRVNLYSENGSAILRCGHWSPRKQQPEHLGTFGEGNGSAWIYNFKNFTSTRSIQKYADLYTRSIYRKEGKSYSLTALKRQDTHALDSHSLKAFSREGSSGQKPPDYGREHYLICAMCIHLE